MLSLLKNCNDSLSTPVIVGGINIHVQDATNAFCKDLIMSMGMFDLCQHVRQPTHILGNTLDLVITSTFFTDKVEKLSSILTTLLANMQLSSKPHDSPCPRMQSSFTTFQPITEESLKHTILKSRANCIPTWLLVKC